MQYGVASLTGIYWGVSAPVEEGLAAGGVEQGGKGGGGGQPTADTHGRKEGFNGGRTERVRGKCTNQPLLWGGHKGRPGAVSGSTQRWKHRPQGPQIRSVPDEAYLCPSRPPTMPTKKMPTAVAKEEDGHGMRHSRCMYIIDTKKHSLEDPTYLCMIW